MSAADEVRAAAATVKAAYLRAAPEDALRLGCLWTALHERVEAIDALRPEDQDKAAKKPIAVRFTGDTGASAVEHTMTVAEILTAAGQPPPARPESARPESAREPQESPPEPQRVHQESPREPQHEPQRVPQKSPRERGQAQRVPQKWREKVARLDHLVAVGESAPVTKNPPATAPTRTLTEKPWQHAAVLPPAPERDPLTCLLPDRRPPLAPGTLVAGRYLIEGCLGFGGVGWVLLARDRTMDQAWRVLKGLRDPGDRTAAEAFLGERQALINHKHQRIVAMLDVVPADQAAGGPYLVMEFIPGGTLEEARGGTAVDVVQALGFGDQILDAFEFLHHHGLIYGDLKPANVMRVPSTQAQDRDPIKLIDFGAVRRADDRVSPPWGTPGLQAPEVERLGAEGASERSDLYTVGRTLMALTLTDDTGVLDLRFPGGRAMRADGVDDVYLRFLDRATALDPEQRFGSAAEMRVQLQGVRRQLRAAATGEPEPVRSTLFSPSACAFALHVDPRRPVVGGLLRQLPMPLVNRADPAAAFLASLGPDSDEVLAQLREAPGPSDGAFFRTVRAHLAVALTARREQEIGYAEQMLAGRPERHRDWALWWHRGLIALVAGRPRDARDEFDQAFGWLPGEVSARLAYAVSCELCGDVEEATRHYEGVWATDRGVPAAGYGLARCLLATATGLSRVVRAAGIVGLLPASDERTAAEIDTIRLVLERYVAELPREGVMFGVPLTVAALGAAFESRCRLLASRTPDRRRRVRLVDAANRLRPASWW